MKSWEDRVISRRDWLGLSLGAGATLALSPALLAASRQTGQQPGGKLLQRAIPSTGEMLPVIGLQFGNPPPADHAALKEVLKTLVEHGGKFLDAVHQSAPAEDITAAIVNELGMQNKIFLATRGSPPGPPKPGAAPAKAQIEKSLERFKVSKLDLVLVNPAVADPTHLEVLKELKKEGRVRYIGAQVIADPQYAKLEAAMRDEPIDFIGIDYSIDNRAVVEERILPLAQERKIGVVAYFPFGEGGQGGLFRRVGATPLPGWAAEFDAKTWAQFFLKYIVGHPAITVVRMGTSQAKHMLDNIGGGIGRLPDEATRKRMAELIDTLPPTAPPGR